DDCDLVVHSQAGSRLTCDDLNRAPALFGGHLPAQIHMLPPHIHPDAQLSGSVVLREHPLYASRDVVRSLHGPPRVCTDGRPPAAVDLHPRSGTAARRFLRETPTARPQPVRSQTHRRSATTTSWHPWMQGISPSGDR